MGKEIGNTPFVLNYQHDIFVSYARENEQWVATFINSLTGELKRQLGNECSLWLTTADSYSTPDFIRRMEKSAVLIMVLSPDYLKSPTYRQGFDTFKDPGQVFIVELPLKQPLPEDITRQLRYDNYYQPRRKTEGEPTLLNSTEEQQYVQELGDLARHLSSKLKEIKEPAGKTSKHTVFLAEVPDDLKNSRKEVKRFLELKKARVLPEKVHLFSVNRQPDITQDITQDLKECRLFVQLLSSNPGEGYPQLQYDCAQKANLPICQWYSPTLDIERVEDFHRELLEKATVKVMELSEFQEDILKQLQPPKEKTSPSHGDLVFVNADREDMRLAHEVADFLKNRKLDYALPMEESSAAPKNITPKQKRQDLLHNLRICDTVIVLYGKACVQWVREQLQYCKRAEKEVRKQPLKVIALYQNGSLSDRKDREPLNIRLSNMLELECPTPEATTCLPKFMEALQR